MLKPRAKPPIVDKKMITPPTMIFKRPNFIFLSFHDSVTTQPNVKGQRGL
jgi:hypothetical protein